MTDKGYRRFLRGCDRQTLKDLAASNAQKARGTARWATDNSRAQHARHAELAREELARREALAAEARTVIDLTRGEATHASFRDLLDGALALECDEALAAALHLWIRAQAGHGPFPPLPVRHRSLSIAGTSIQILDEEPLRKLLSGDTEPTPEATRAPQPPPAPASAVLTEQEKARLEDGKGRWAASEWDE